MKKFIALIIFLPALHSYSQETKSDIVSVTTLFERIEIIKIPSGYDLLNGLDSVIQEKNIKNAVFLSGIGSVTDYHFHVVTDKNLPPANGFSESSTAMDVVSLQGYVLNRRIHAHISFSDENSMVGGHLEPGTKALTFFIVTLGVLPDSLNIKDFDTYKK